MAERLFSPKQKKEKATEVKLLLTLDIGK